LDRTGCRRGAHPLGRSEPARDLVVSERRHCHRDRPQSLGPNAISFGGHRCTLPFTDVGAHLVQEGQIGPRCPPAVEAGPLCSTAGVA
jgi:hypothetical protein